MRARVAEARAGAHNLEEFVGDAYRAYFSFIVEDPPTFELTRRNAGTIRTLFDEPVLGAARDDLHADLRAAIERGEMPPFDTEYMTAAMAGVALEVGIRMIERDPPDVDGAARVRHGGVPGRHRAVGTVRARRVSPWSSRPARQPTSRSA